MDSPLCRACMEAEETAAHVVIKCQGVAEYRAQHLGSTGSLPEVIGNVRGLLGFLVFQSEQIQWLAADDLRHAIGMTMGRIFELHRQQVDMYRRMKRIVEGQFTWLRPELAGVFHQLGPQSGVAEPAAGFEQFKPNQYDQKWVSNVKQTYQDYKPHIYITALEYITKKQTQIENLVKLLTTYTAEEEVDRFKPYNLPMGQDHLAVWKGYQTKIACYFVVDV
ncbi:uncharacterized protein LOC134677235 [Cydia fagiglandana]|uniref:uncharacterized protein LOC134677235 n=1 Tax=Cydia fagiglandana TaxID=1458189 RepID=UPI002FEE2C8B